MLPITTATSSRLAFQARDGREYILRQATAADRDSLEAFLRNLSPRSHWLRFMTPRPFSDDMARAEVGRMLMDQVSDHITVLATTPRSEAETVVGVAELVYNRQTSCGEIALVVSDNLQGQGIGRALLGRLVQIAQEISLTCLRGDLLAENGPMRRLISGLNLPAKSAIQAGEMRVVLRVPQREATRV